MQGAFRLNALRYSASFRHGTLWCMDGEYGRLQASWPVLPKVCRIPWGIPAAIGAKCAVSERPVVCFTGDGGVYYHLTELDTALRYGINPVIVVNNNSSLNQEQGGVEGTYGLRNKLTDEKWILSDMDFDNSDPFSP